MSNMAWKDHMAVHIMDCVATMWAKTGKTQRTLSLEMGYPYNWFSQVKNRALNGQNVTFATLENLCEKVGLKIICVNADLADKFEELSEAIIERKAENGNERTPGETEMRN